MTQTGTSEVARAPTRFRCKVGGEWKELSEFSNAQQKNLQYLSAGNRRVDPAHSGMTCKTHSAGSRSELRCEMCRLVKPLDMFSKNSRRNGEYQCKRCVAWVETAEPDVTPGPLETGHISPEEELQQLHRARNFKSSDFFGDEEDMQPRAPITGMASLGLSDKYSSLLGAMSSSDTASNAGTTSTCSITSNLPRHLLHKATEVVSKANGPSSSASSVLGNSLPPHLRHKAKSTTGSSASSTSGDMSLPTTLLNADSDSASVGKQSFHAWGPGGTYMRRRNESITDSMTGSSYAESDAASVVDADPNVVGDWSRCTALAKPANTTNKGNPFGKESKLTVTELREARGETYQTYIRKDFDTQKLVRPIGYEDDDDSD